MKRILLLVSLLTIAFAAGAQLPHHSFTWDGVEREYIVVTPPNMDTAQPRGMLLMLHGLRNSIDTVDGVVNLAALSELSGWVCVVPQALDCVLDFGFTTAEVGSCWNSGINAMVWGTPIPLNADVDDVGFLLALLDSLCPVYNIAADSLYVTGISMGGFMTHRLLIEAGNRFAAAVPISGTIANTLEDSLPQHGSHPRIMHIHGTADEVVQWNGDFYYRSMSLEIPHIGMGVDDCLDYWIDYNHCDTQATIDTLEDRCEDGLQFVRHRYGNGLDGSEVVLMEVIGGEHTWYANARIHDVDYGTEIYKFCTGKNAEYPAEVGIAAAEGVGEVPLWPNPANGNVYVSMPGEDGSALVEVYDLQGRLVLQQRVAEAAKQVLLNTETLPRGVYVVKVSMAARTAAAKLVKK